MIKISIRDSLKHDKDFNPKQELMKQVNWGGGTSNPKAAVFGNLLDLLELRQKVLMKYQSTDFYEKKRYENMLKRIQGKILAGFEKAIDTWIATHQEQVDIQTLDKQIQALESLKNKYPDSSSIAHMDYKKIALFMAAQMVASSSGIDEKKFEDMFFKMAIENNLYKYEKGPALSSKEILKKIDVKKLIQLIINELTARKLTASSNMKIKDYISKAKSSGDIRDQIVTFEQALNAVHNSGPLMQYLIVDDYNRPLVDAPEPFIAFLDYLSNMSDKDLELTKEDTEKLQSVAVVNYRTVISFLGRGQQKTWGKPASAWMKCNDGSAWTKEFMEAFGIKNNNESINEPRYFALGSDWGVTTGSTSFGPGSGDHYWNPNPEYKDIFIIITRRASAGIEERLEKLKEFIDSDPDKARVIAASCDRIALNEL